VNAETAWGGRSREPMKNPVASLAQAADEYERECCARGRPRLRVCSPGTLLSGLHRLEQRRQDCRRVPCGVVPQFVKDRGEIGACRSGGVNGQRSEAVFVEASASMV